MAKYALISAALLALALALAIVSPLLALLVCGLLPLATICVLLWVFTRETDRHS
jgi:hypothetical protein